MSRLLLAVLVCVVLAVFNTSLSARKICDVTKNPVVNVAFRKPSYLSSYYSYDKWGPQKGNDGNPDSDLKDDSCFYTNITQNPWWKVNLHGLYCISQVNITNRADCCGDRTQNVEISASSDLMKWTVLAYKDGPMGDFFSASFKPLETSFVKVTLKDTIGYMHLCEVEVFGYNSET